MRSVFLLAAGFVAALVLVFAASKTGQAGADRIAGETAQPVHFEADAPKRFVTRHKIELDGKTIKYTAIAGETYLVNAGGEPTASIFSFSYVKDDPAGASRPVLFVFGGGPGSASIWLHMGSIGPERVKLDNEVNSSNTPPFGYGPNPFSLLDVADIVFIDPVGTGFSRAIGAGKPADFWGVDEDANSIAQFIELWLSENGRWNSPKFLLGESYGSQRAALLPRALMGGPFYGGVMRGITVNGVVLLGTTLDDLRAAKTDDEKAMRAALNLPGFAATAWRFEKVDRKGRTLDEFVAEAKEFATSRYLSALKKEAAKTLGENERKQIVAELTAYTGLRAEAFKDGLAVAPKAFATELLADQGLAVGMYDSRFTLPSKPDGGDPVADDPAMGRYVPGFVAAFHDMLRNELKVDMRRPYAAIMWKDLLSSWNWKRAGVPEGQSFAVDLAWAMRRTPKMRVLVTAGDFDLVTPAAEAQRQIADAGLPADRTTFKTYHSGHMLFLGESAGEFANDLREFIKSAE